MSDICFVAVDCRFRENVVVELPLWAGFYSDTDLMLVQ